MAAKFMHTDKGREAHLRQAAPDANFRGKQCTM